MTPNHEAAKNAAKLLRDFFTFSNGEYGEREQRNLAVSYLDLLTREQRAVELLQGVVDDEQCQLDHHGVCQTHWGRPCGMAQIRDFLAEREVSDE